MTYIIEATWNGYETPRIVHRTIHPDFYPQLREWVLKNKTITFTDGTHLVLSVREKYQSEQIDEVHGYDALISDCFRHDLNNVRDLMAAKKDALPQ